MADVFPLCPPTLLCVFLSDEELDNRNGREQFVELDSLDTEKALLLTDDDDPLWVWNQLTLKLALHIQKWSCEICSISLPCIACWH